ncbi:MULTISPECIES: hypothetical protein [unclassified Rhizobium]|uniref:hypothetical protein n=1 Tax=unclassified Rhizobium TaxID=2613769 RepID=UPI002479C5A6|nr:MULTISPECIES: hypothetical protein [unclassified Rhizobium]MDH7802233.1 hypothetical protein [Rhizobium sp. AN70]
MKIDEKKTYDVKLARPVNMGPFRYRPLNEIEMSGAILKAIIEQEGEDVCDYANAR